MAALLEPVRQLGNGSLARAVAELCLQDADLAVLVRRWGPPPLWGRRPGFVTLLRIILEQQVSLASARALFLRLRDRLPEVTPPVVAGVGVSGLRNLGFTRQKAAYCHALAVELTAGRLDLTSFRETDDSTVRAALLRLHGVGPWTADIYLLMALRRPDVWPAGDLALAQVMREIKRLPARPTPERMQRLAARWAPWRAVAARILWQHYLSVRRERRVLP
jgi:DNA-3-methyladenine glycosylase II